MRPSSHLIACAMFATTIYVATGCKTRNYQIVSEPPGAFVTINKNPHGETPVEMSFNFRRTPVYDIKCTLQGYFPAEYRLNARNFGQVVRNGYLSVGLTKNPAWEETTESKATNVWLRVQVSNKLDENSVWQKLVDSVTTVYDSLEQLDKESGYLRSNWRVKTYLAPDGKYFKIKTQFVGSIASKEPLVYKFKIVSYYVDQTSSEGTAYDRVFKQDAQLVQELDSRLSEK